MKCMEARRMVTPYVNRTLSDKETEQFLDHVEHCRDCMEELDIYFTMYKAMDSLDSGSHQEYNFKKMLEEDIHAARRSILVHKLSRITRIMIVLIAEVLLIGSVFTGYAMRKGDMTNQNMFQKAILRLNPRYQGKNADDPLKKAQEAETLKQKAENAETEMTAGTQLPVQTEAAGEFTAETETSLTENNTD